MGVTVSVGVAVGVCVGGILVDVGVGSGIAVSVGIAVGLTGVVEEERGVEETAVSPSPKPAQAERKTTVSRRIHLMTEK